MSEEWKTIVELAEEYLKMKEHYPPTVFAYDEGRRLHAILLLMDGPHQKDRCVAELRAYFAKFQVSEYFFSACGFSLKVGDDPEKKRAALEQRVYQHPDRVECLYIYHQTLTGSDSKLFDVVRDGSGQYVSLVEKDVIKSEDLTGRFTDLLPDLSLRK